MLHDVNASPNANHLWHPVFFASLSIYSDFAFALLHIPLRYLRLSLNIP